MSSITDRVLLAALGSDFSEFTVVPASGASGAILVAWRRHTSCGCSPDGQ
jgi:hypothetical protein